MRMGVLLRNVLVESKDGPEVLAWFLKQLKYNQIIDHPEEMGLHNVAARLLHLMDFHSETQMPEQIRAWRHRRINGTPNLD